MSYLHGLVSDTRRLLATHSDVLVITVTTTVALLLGQYRIVKLTGLGPGWPQVIIALGRTGLYLALPLVSLSILKLRPRDLGFGIGNWRCWLPDITILYLVMLPLVVWAATRAQFRNVYPYFHLARLGLKNLVRAELALLLLMFAWEFLFRGYLLFGLERRLGNYAIVVQMVPFALMHLGKPELEAYGSIIAGLVLGIVAVRGRSFLPAFILHYAVALSLDLLALR